jgi:hypothetical protein
MRQLIFDFAKPLFELKEVRHAEEKANRRSTSRGSGAPKTAPRRETDGGFERKNSATTSEKEISYAY